MIDYYDRLPGATVKIHPKLQLQSLSYLLGWVELKITFFLFLLNSLNLFYLIKTFLFFFFELFTQYY